MSHPPAARLPAAAVLTAATLLTATACLAVTPEQAQDPLTVTSPGTERDGQASPTPGLTDAQVRAALINEADLGAPWMPSEGAATWRDGLLKGTANAAPDCQRLLEGLYTEELLGPPSGGQAVTALDDGDDQAQLRYQVAVHRPADVDRTLAWLKTLPGTCGQFMATTTRAGVEAVQVEELPLPALGDARQGLRVTLTGEGGTDGEAAPVLTLDVAAVRAGDNAILLTIGALDTVPPDDLAPRTLALGTGRLIQIREQSHTQA
ncbi:hypothetical protein [Streptomyces sp. NPDC051636]|uniref:hypothetical protein n=1 Tax=Streptomyces sp. NPDC051636 TaxID=3365663 RepID=UPI0037BA568D